MPIAANQSDHAPLHSVHIPAAHTHRLQAARNVHNFAIAVTSPTSVPVAMCQVRLWQVGRLLPPRISHHLEAHGALPVLYASSWLLTCFSADFPLSFAARVMDAVLSSAMPEPMMKVRACVGGSSSALRERQYVCEGGCSSALRERQKCIVWSVVAGASVCASASFGV